MLLDHTQATAKLTIDGLAICCFNSGESKWDVAFLRHPQQPHHELILRIESEEAICIPEDTAVISFETVNGYFPDGYPQGFFDNGPISDRKTYPVTTDEKENFRWVIDLENPLDVDHGNATLKPSGFPVTRTFIQDAVFYTTERSPQDLLLVLDTENPNQMADPHVFGKTNDEIAADIFCNPGGQVIIKIDGAERRRLDQRPGNPWQICLTNLCLQLQPTGERFEKGDFQLFYDALNITGQRHALWGEPVPGVVHCHPFTEVGFLRERASGRTDCDTTRMGTSQTLDAILSGR